MSLYSSSSAEGDIVCITLVVISQLYSAHPAFHLSECTDIKKRADLLDGVGCARAEFLVSPSFENFELTFLALLMLRISYHGLQDLPNR